MSAPPRVFALASFMRDLSVVVDRCPAAGETLAGRDALEAPGGKGSNQAIQAARCGARVALLAGVGDDAAGAAARALWLAEGIDASAVRVMAGEPTGQAMILVESGGENRIVIAPGANQGLRAGDAERARALIAGADLVLATLETPLELTEAVFAMARGHGVPTLLNTAPARAALPASLWALTDIVVANEGEAALLAGDAGAGPPASGEPAPGSLSVGARRVAPTGPLALASALLGRVRLAAVVTLGERGALLLQSGQPALSCPPPAVAVVDSTGAGDAFVGAFACRWAAGDPAAVALRHGVTAGALACTRRGAVPALAAAAAIAALLPPAEALS